MTEEAMFPFRALFVLINLGAIAVVIIIFVWLFLSATIDIRGTAIKRATYQLRDNLVNSELTSDIGVFDKEMLDRYSNDPLKKIEEPYARHCSYGYRFELEDLETEEKWEFGYKPKADVLEWHKLDQPTPVAISLRDEAGSRVIHPAHMTITLYDTYLTRISCMIEKTYETGEEHRMKIPCMNKYAEGEQYECNFGISKYSGISDEPDKICLNYVEGDDDCRYMDPDIILKGTPLSSPPSYNWKYKVDKGDERRFLRATLGGDGVELEIIENDEE